MKERGGEKMEREGKRNGENGEKGKREQRDRWKRETRWNDRELAWDTGTAARLAVPGASAMTTPYFERPTREPNDKNETMRP